MTVENAGGTGEEGGSLHASVGFECAGREQWMMSFMKCLFHGTFWRDVLYAVFVSWNLLEGWISGKSLGKRSGTIQFVLYKPC